MQSPEMFRGADAGLTAEWPAVPLVVAPQQCAFIDDIPSAYAAALFDGDWPQMAGPVGVRVYELHVGPARCAWLAIPLVELVVEAQPVEVYGRKLIIGAHVPASPYFPTTTAYLAWCRFNAIAECQMTRLTWCYPIWAPMLGIIAQVMLPGEITSATCLYLHRDGTWEGKIVGLTVNEMTPAQIKLLNHIHHLSGTPFELIANRHGYRRGHVVKWRLDQHNAWVPGEPAGGVA